MSHLNRRTFLAAGAAAMIPAAAKGKHPPIGLELYSVRDELKKDLMGTVRQVAKYGYECVEFFSPYYEWTPAYAKDVRKLLDDLNIKAYSTHNSAKNFDAENLPKAIELNQILGAKYVVMASAGRVNDLDGWKVVADKLTKGSETLKGSGMRAGFHNHAMEFKAINGTMPMEVLAKNTPKDVCLQFDVGTCVEVGVDPVEWIKKNPGRIKSMHVKDWGPESGYKVLFGEGKVPWKQVFEAAEKTGGIDFYLIEQEGSAFPPFETVEKCINSYKKMRG